MADVWCVAVFRCEPRSVTKCLVEFYDFVKDIDGVKSVHFLIRDRVGKEVVFSFECLYMVRRRKLLRARWPTN